MRADAKAFSKLMSHLRTVDEREHTVIGVQVENETGIQGAKREHSDLADQLFKDVVPEDFANYMGKAKGYTWEDTFGRDAEETFSAFYIASYVEHVAKAGKKEYHLPGTSHYRRNFCCFWLLMNVDKELCVNPSKTPNHSECIRCTNCVENCPAGALKLGAR